MKKPNTASRRAFLRGGALLAAPLAAVGVPAAALADRSRASAERLQSELAIRDLHQSWLRRVNAGEQDGRIDPRVRRIIVDHAGAPDEIEIAADGRSAIGRFDYLVEFDMPFIEDCTLAQMAVAQGQGAPCKAERRHLTVEYAKSGGRWTITQVALAAA